MSSSAFSRPPFNSNNKPGNNRTLSLIEKLQNSPIDAAQPPKPKPFDMSEPFQQSNGLWCFWLTADPHIIKFVSHLSCILPAPAPPFTRSTPGRTLFSINPRYQPEDAWIWVHRLLEGETEDVELSDIWADALEDDDII